MLDELKAHLEEMLRGFRSGVAVAEEHLVEALNKVERAAANLVAPVAGVVTGEAAGTQSTATDLGAGVAEHASSATDNTTSASETGTSAPSTEGTSHDAAAGESAGPASTGEAAGTTQAAA